MITKINESKTYHPYVNKDLMVKNVIQIKCGMSTINVNVSVKILNNIMCVKKIIFEILFHVVAKIVNI